MLTRISADIMCEVIYIFVDIGGIVDDHCIQLIFISRCPVNIGPSWSWSFGSLIYDSLCTQCLSRLTLCVRIPLRWGVLKTILRDKVSVTTAGRWYSSGTPVSSINKSDRQDITEILLKVALNTISQPSKAHVWNFSLMVRCLSRIRNTNFTVFDLTHAMVVQH